MWINTDTKELADEAAVLAAFPNTVFARNAQGQIEPPEPFAPLVTEPEPDHDQATQKVVPRAPAPVDGVWRQDWDVLPLTAAEKAAARKALVPAVVSRAQGKIVLIEQGLYDLVLAVIDAIPDPVQKAIANVSFHDTQEWRADSPFLHLMAVQLELTEAQFDDLFIAAGQVQI